jgi:voltage-gated potassium channel
MLTQFLIYAAYRLKTSPSYRATKLFFYNLLENPKSSLKSGFDAMMIGLIVLSVFFLLYDVEHEASPMGGYIEQAILVVFILEYLLRFWVYSDSHLLVIEAYEKASYLNVPFSLWAVIRHVVLKKLEYVFSPLAIIDLLAILPSYRPLRILRIFLVFRLFKLFRYSDSARLFSDVLATKRYELLTLLVLATFLIFTASVSVYIFEHPEPDSKIKTLFDAVYWAIVTLATVGYGDIIPHTVGGKLVTILLILTSLGVLSFFTSILISAFNEKMPVLRENRTVSELERYKNFIIICGYGRVGHEIARQLSQDGQKFIIVDPKEHNINLAKQQGYLTLHADASRNDVLRRAGICSGASSILCITGDDVTNVYVTLTSRYLNKDIQIISRANQHENINKLYQAGADHVIRPFEIAGMLAAEFLGQPVAFEAINGILQNRTELVMDTLLVPEGCWLVNKTLEDAGLAEQKLILLGVISGNPIHFKHKNKYQVKQQHFYFNPAPKFIIRQEDMLVVLGRRYGIDHFRDQIERYRLLARKY